MKNSKGKKIFTKYFLIKIVFVSIKQKEYMIGKKLKINQNKTKKTNLIKLIIFQKILIQNLNKIFNISGNMKKIYYAGIGKCDNNKVIFL